MRLTEQQQRAVGAPGSVAVVAGAGCGKTSLLVERYLHHMAEDGVSPLEIVAVTFTEKAAEELRSRIRRRAGEVTGLADEAAAELEAAQISTIHALCARLCREHPEEAGVSPDFSILDEVTGGVWMEDRLLDALDALPLEIHEQIPYGLLKTALEALLSDPIPAERSLRRALDDGLDGWKALADRERESAVSGFLGDEEVEECAAVLHACAGADGDLAEENRALAVSALRNLSDPEASDDPDRVSEAFDALMSIKLRGGKKGNWSGDDLSLVKDALKRLRTRVQDEIKRGLVTLSTGPADEKLAEVLPALFSAFVRVSESLAEAKRRTRVLDFADLEACALRALEYEEVRSYYHKRWEAFLVDECQDTNPVQAEILDRLTGGAKLNVVGDEKQSIYGFRRADVGVFRGFRARVDEAPDGTEEVLATTFRSHGSLISKLNAVFSPVLGDLHQNLYANRVEPPHPAPHVRLFAVESEEKVGKAALERVEAAHIAGLVRQMVDDGIPVHDGSRTRPAGPEDFAVLSRTWSPLEGCGEALSAVGIPSVHAGGGNLLDTREAKDGQIMLRFLAHPEDDLALVAVLRSPFFAVDDPTLHGIALNMGDGESWWDAIQACYGVPEPLSLAREVIQELLDRSRTEEPGAMLASADRLTGYTAVISNLSGSERREADWRGFVELVRDLEVGHGSVFAVTRSLGRMREADIGVPRPVVAAEGAVSLMTVHSAKGLEWPVVIVPDLSRVPPSFSPKVLFDPGLGVGLDFGDEVGKDADPPVVYRLVKDRLTRQRKEEDKRLFYVALTRARDHLILTTTDADTQSDCGMALLRPGFEAAGVEAVPVPFGSTCRGPDQLGVPVDLRFTSEVTKKGANTTKHGENS